MSRSVKILACLLSLGTTAYTYGNDKPVTVIEPDKSMPTIQVAAIDTEKFELGAYVGLLSVEDFNTNPVTGVSFTYHINRKFIAQANYGISTVGKAAFEEVAGGNFLADDEYDFEYINLLAGYNLLDGRSFLGKRHKFNSAIYLLAGVADVSFAGNDKTGMVIGASYRAVVTDWMTINLDLRDTIVDREFLGDSKKTNNTEMLIGVNALF
ncbi:outer membrane beta-barrel domain-containing protein [Cellvibrio sp. ARAG 10.3]|uniref:outer membrane beta-barrel domain-containing protein n=1 Tax=Cellvibrio sp. ARAG 10.3 TaxID=3451358 RepID=UPI003F4714EF